MLSIRRLVRLAPPVFGVATLLGAAAASETITATAHVKSAAGVEASAPLTIVIDRFASDAERDELVAAVKESGTAGAKKLLSGRAQVGWVETATGKVPVQYAYARPLGDGRLVTVVTATPIAFVGAGMPNAKPTTGFELGLVLLEINTAGSGSGELVPAAKVKVNPDGAIVTEDYSAEVVKLSKVAGK